MQKCQEALKVTAVNGFYHGFCSAAEFLRKSGKKGSAATGRDGAGHKRQPGAASTALECSNMWLSIFYRHKAAKHHRQQARLKEAKYQVKLIFL